MTFRRLVLRSVRYHWRALTMVCVGIAVAGGVITGSLVVGDSVRASVREAATERLGRIDYALSAPSLFRDDLAADLLRDRVVATRFRRMAPVLIDRGAATKADTGATAPIVNVIGVDDRFRDFFPLGALADLRPRDAIVNASVAHDLSLRTGDGIIITLPRGAEADPRSIFAHRKREDISQALRVTVRAIVSDTGAGGFALDAATTAHRDIFVSRQWLARSTDRDGRANAIVAELRHSARADSGNALDNALAAAATLDDRGLRIARSDTASCLCVQSAAPVLSDAQAQGAVSAAADGNLAAWQSSAYLATSIRRVHSPARSIAYAVVASADPHERFRVLQGTATPGPDGITLNGWAADALGARVGDAVALDYLVPQPDGTYATQSIALVVRGIVAMSGSGADPHLAPEVPGVTDAAHMGDWRAPFPVDLARVTRADEAYWDRYRAAPKAFVSLDTARGFWRDASTGWVTAVRIAIPPGPRAAETERVLAASLLRRLPARDAGLYFRPVRSLAVDASSGTGDFGGLFLGLGMFLVVAALALASTLMRLNAERRAFELGVLLACGVTERDVRRIALAESLAPALAGSVAGCGLGAVYAWLIVELLATRWAGAVGSASILLFVEPASIGAGFVAGLVAGLGAAWWTSRRLGREPVVRLLRGMVGERVGTGVRVGRAFSPISAVFFLLALAAVVAPGVSRAVSPVAAFFVAGACALIAVLGALGGLISVAGARPAARSIARLAARNVGAHRRHAVLIAGIAAAAAFVLVTAASNRREFSAADVYRRESGSGGFALVASSSLPVAVDFGTPAGRKSIGFSQEDERLFRGVTVVPFLLSPGDDVSCLNLARPQTARILGVPRAMIERGGFRVATASGPSQSAWQQLESEPDGRGIPAFGDSESVTWTLHSGLGESYMTPGGDGQPVNLRFSGLVEQSIFAGELLVSERNFRRMYPSVRQPRYFLIETPPGRERAVAGALRRNMGEAGLEVREARAILKEVAGVQNTYLSAFTALGALGLLLGSAGLAAALLRAALERRRELAILLATGFARRRIAALLALEHAAPLTAGVLIGAVCALLATAPQARSSGVPIAWGEVGVLLAGIVACGVALCAWAGGTAVSGSLIGALREE